MSAKDTDPPKRVTPRDADALASFVDETGHCCGSKVDRL